MKKLIIPQYIFYNLLLLITIICILSCTYQEKQYTDSIYKMESPKEDPIIDFNTIDRLNESNQKIIELSSISLRSTKNLKALHLLLKIKIDNQKINSDFKKLTSDNLIIIPKLSYQIDIHDDSINNKSSGLYIIKKLETEIKNQIIAFDCIEKNTQNIDFKIFSIQSKRKLYANNDALKTLLSN